MNKILFILCGLFLMSTQAWADRYGEGICEQEGYVCYTVKKQDSWESLFPNAEQRDIVQRLNRMNIGLRRGETIAVPTKLDQLTIYDVAPFPRYMKSTGEKVIYVNQQELAWGAYDATGELQWWGPISTGRDWCNDIDDECTTPAGDYRIYRKSGIDCVSTIFPKRINDPSGGAPMPFCMHFVGGFALHGSEEVPGYRASHGCVRLFYEDAKWLNTQFIDIPGKGYKGTRVIVGDI
jgi:hypothetical protein